MTDCASATATPVGDEQLPGVRPVAQRAATHIRTRLGFTGDIGGFATSGHMEGSKHYQGLALDVMVPLGAEATRIADYFAGPGYRPFAVDNVIHDHRIYNAGRGWHAYHGASPHTDHVHIDFHDQGGDGMMVPASESVGCL